MHTPSKSKIQFIDPQRARLRDRPPNGNEWMHEIKFDGYRTLARISGGTVTLCTRSGLDWTEKYLKLAREFHKLKAADALLDGGIAVPGAKSVTWVQPKLVAQIKFAEFTGDHIIRHASFVEMREDKAPGDVKIANAKTVKSAKNAKTSRDQVSKGVGGVLISHPERSIFEIGQDPITKFELAEYYELVSNRMVDFIRDRPLSLLRCPDGKGKECFFQKHLVSGKKSAIHQFKKALKERSEKKVSGVCIDSTQGLIDLVQMGIVEIHNWGCHLNQIERPDSVVFDLDPDPSVKWPQVIEAANLIRETLLQLKLVPFLKVTGGKGLHIHVPIEKKYTWNEAKLFTKTVAAEVSRREPKLYTTELMKKKRAGKIFIDYLRNGYGATAVAPYSVRARANAPVALPIEWSALTRNLEPAGFHLRDIARYLKDQKRDPWGGYSEAARRVPILEELSRVARKKR